VVASRDSPPLARPHNALGSRRECQDAKERAEPRPRTPPCTRDALISFARAPSRRLFRPTLRQFFDHPLRLCVLHEAPCLHGIGV